MFYRDVIRAKRVQVAAQGGGKDVIAACLVRRVRSSASSARVLYRTPRRSRIDAQRATTGSRGALRRSDEACKLLPSCLGIGPKETSPASFQTRPAPEPLKWTTAQDLVPPFLRGDRTHRRRYIARFQLLGTNSSFS